jgi:circadian clock protein KaiB
MKNRLKKLDPTQEFEEILGHGGLDEAYVLRLYVTGMTPRSAEALASIKAICEKHLQGRYDLEVIDLYQHPALASEEQIIATPTLIKRLPAPLRRLVGNLAHEERVLFGLDLQPRI